MMRAEIRSSRWTAHRPDVVTVEIELPAATEADRRLAHLATDGNYLLVKPAPWWHRAKLAINRKWEGG